MKTFKILFAAIIFAGFTTSAMAQDNQAEATATAEILQDIEVANVADINFGIIDPSASGEELTLNVLDHNDHGERIGLYDSSANLGKFSIDGQTNDVEVTINWEYNDLEFDGQSLGWSPEVGFNLADEDSGSETIDNSGDSRTLTDSVGYVFVGGSLDEADKDPGTYTGDFTLTVEFN